MAARVALILIFILSMTAWISAQTADTHEFEVSSPDGNLHLVLSVKEMLEPYPAGQRLYYRIEFKNRPVLLDSPFRLDLKGMKPFAGNLRLTQVGERSVDNVWAPVVGTHSRIEDRYNEATFEIVESTEAKRELQWIVRVYNDGAAFRYVIPEQPGIRQFKITAERSEFHFPGDPTVWAADYESFRTHQETEFEKGKLSSLRPSALIGCPILFEGDGFWFALTEAELNDWAGLYFKKNPLAFSGLTSVLSPRLDEPDVAVISQTRRMSPWRVIMVGDRVGDLIESNLILNLNPPNAIEDPSWIRPGKSAWDRWWCGSYAPDFDGELGMSSESMKYFVDFAAEMNWEYQLVDWTWYGPPFDSEKPFGTAGNPGADLARSIPELDIPELVKYAGQKGVRILIWLDWFNADQQMEKVFPLYEQWGVAGVKVDFMARDDQEVVNFYHRLVKLAAKHHLTVDFHGAYKPTGFRRTYPNLLTREGVLGNEYNKWSNRVTPTHNVTLPFTRMLAGPMDFTPGGFRHKTVENFRIAGDDTPGPFVMGTRAHQLAMLVIYESPLQVLTDSPYSYRMSPAGLDFLKLVPTSWDDSRVIDGYPGEFIVMARKADDTWYLGGMSGSSPKSVRIPLEFLGGNTFAATIYSDAEEVRDYPEHLRKAERAVRADDVLEIEMAAGGGFVAVIQ